MTIRAWMKSRLRDLSDAVATPQRPTVYLGDHTVLTKTAAGHTLYLDTRDRGITPTILTTGVWQREVSTFLTRTLKTGARVIEIGANIGSHTVDIARSVGPTGAVIAYEPNPRTAALLRANLEVNGVLAWCDVRETAVAAQAGEVTFHVFDHHPASSSLVAFDQTLEATIGDRARAITVNCVALDDDPPAVDVIKMDAEGAEPQILDGMMRTLERNKQVTVLCEFNPTFIRRSGRDPQAFLTAWTAAGFILRRLTADGSVEDVSPDTLLRTEHASVWGADDELVLRRQ
jgi:FkbM family methyltransferase